MIVVRGGGAFALPETRRGSAITVGTFDGVHRGHQDVAARLVRLAQSRELDLAHRHVRPAPAGDRESGRGAAAADHERREARGARADRRRYVVVLPFTPTLAALSAEAFVDDVLRSQCRLEALLIGHDHGFGRGRMGDASVLQALGAQRGFGGERGGAGAGPTATPSRPRPFGAPWLAATSCARPRGWAALLRQWQGRSWRPARAAARLSDDQSRATVAAQAAAARRCLRGPRGADPMGRIGGMLNLGARPTLGRLGTPSRSAPVRRRGRLVRCAGGDSVPSATARSAPIRRRRGPARAAGSGRGLGARRTGPLSYKATLHFPRRACHSVHAAAVIHVSGLKPRWRT